MRRWFTGNFDTHATEPQPYNKPVGDDCQSAIAAHVQARDKTKMLNCFVEALQSSNGFSLNQQRNVKNKVNRMFDLDLNLCKKLLVCILSPHVYVHFHS